MVVVAEFSMRLASSLGVRLAMAMNARMPNSAMNPKVFPQAKVYPPTVSLWSAGQAVGPTCANTCVLNSCGELLGHPGWQQ